VNSENEGIHLKCTNLATVNCNVRENTNCRANLSNIHLQTVVGTILNNIHFSSHTSEQQRCNGRSHPKIGSYNYDQTMHNGRPNTTDTKSSVISGANQMCSYKELTTLSLPAIAISQLTSNQWKSNYRSYSRRGAAWWSALATWNDPWRHRQGREPRSRPARRGSAWRPTQAGTWTKEPDRPDAAVPGHRDVVPHFRTSLE